MRSSVIPLSRHPTQYHHSTHTGRRLLSPAAFLPHLCYFYLTSPSTTFPLPCLLFTWPGLYSLGLCSFNLSPPYFDFLPSHFPFRPSLLVSPPPLSATLSIHLPYCLTCTVFGSPAFPHARFIFLVSWKPGTRADRYLPALTAQCAFGFCVPPVCAPHCGSYSTTYMATYLSSTRRCAEARAGLTGE